ncbi:MAG: hypothetical protein JKX99_08170 [Robiginitomaculum sp.]|nr:hypothetical protein [Robiginitomaculum sp.]
MSEPPLTYSEAYQARLERAESTGYTAKLEVNGANAGYFIIKDLGWPLGICGDMWIDDPYLDTASVMLEIEPSECDGDWIAATKEPNRQLRLLDMTSESQSLAACINRTLGIWAADATTSFAAPSRTEWVGRDETSLTVGISVNLNVQLKTFNYCIF